jgi:hypothetical protein
MTTPAIKGIDPALVVRRYRELYAHPVREKQPETD